MLGSYAGPVAALAESVARRLSICHSATCWRSSLAAELGLCCACHGLIKQLLYVYMYNLDQDMQTDQFCNRLKQAENQFYYYINT